MNGLGMPSGFRIPSVLEVLRGLERWEKVLAPTGEEARSCKANLPGFHAGWARVDERDVLLLTKEGTLLLVPIPNAGFLDLVTTGRIRMGDMLIEMIPAK